MNQDNAAEKMTKFLTVPVKYTNVDDLRLDSLIKQGDQGQIVLVGCPFDYTRKRTISKGGQQNGPCCIRRFFHKIGPLYNSQFQISISQIKISDYGNIHPSNQQKSSPQQIITKISQEIFTILQNDKFPFIIGGSKQTSLGSARAFHKKYQNGKHLIISGLPFLKRPFDNDKLTSDNLLTILTTENPEKQILFGPHQKQLPNNFNNNFEYFSYNQIYEYNQGEDWKLGYSCKPVKKLASVIQKDTPYHVTLSVEAIQRFNGCRDLPTYGIKPQEMIQIFLWLGQQPNIKSLDITQFNPSCQDYQSSLTLLNFLYYFLMGWAKKKQSLNH